MVNGKSTDFLETDNSFEEKKTLYRIRDDDCKGISKSLRKSKLPVV